MIWLYIGSVAAFFAGVALARHVDHNLNRTLGGRVSRRAVALSAFRRVHRF